jgi:hypothetical protein
MEKEKVDVIRGCTDDDLIRIWGLLKNGLYAVEVELSKRKIPLSKVAHNSKKLSIQYIVSDEEIEIDFR